MINIHRVLALLIIGCSALSLQAQPSSAIEFYDTTGTESTSKIGWTGNAEDGHFFIETPDDNSGVTVKNGNIEVDGTVTAEKFVGDGSGLTNLVVEAGSDNAGIESAFVRDDSLLIALSSGDTINAGKVKGEPGNDGNGTGIGSAFVENDSLFIALTDGDTINAGKVKGEPGSGGSGTGVSSAFVENDSLFIALTDGDTINAGKVKGEPGDDGNAGTDGISVNSAFVRSDSLFIALSDKDTINAGRVTGEPGDDGNSGTDGVSVASAFVRSDSLFIALGNRDTVNAGMVKGPKGDTGETGPQGPSNGWEITDSMISTQNNINEIYLGNKYFRWRSYPAGQIDFWRGRIRLYGYEPNSDSVWLTNTGLVFFSQHHQTDIGSRSISTGDLNASRVVVNGNELDVPDYVFEDNYNLLELHELETFIRKNKHLPEVQSAKEVQEKGLDVVEMNLDLLKKVEELTLYLLEQNKKIESLKQKVDELQSQ
ncbi:MAG: hypothetical protein ACLFSB_15680 [Chitinispirillaceae bacterium]